MSQGQIKRLARHGNSSALVIDRPVLELLGIDDQTELKITTDGTRLIIEPLSAEERKMRLEAVVKKTGQQNAELFKRLAK
jgi:antitoxin MazE